MGKIQKFLKNRNFLIFEIFIFYNHLPDKLYINPFQDRQNVFPELRYEPRNFTIFRKFTCILKII